LVLHVGTPPKVVRFTDKEIADIEQVKKKIALNSAGIV